MTSSTRSAVSRDSAARTVPFLNFPAQFAEERDELTGAMIRIFEQGDFVGGAEIEAFERDVQAYTGAPHCIARSTREPMRCCMD